MTKKSRKPRMGGGVHGGPYASNKSSPGRRRKYAVMDTQHSQGSDGSPEMVVRRIESFPPRYVGGDDLILCTPPGSMSSAATTGNNNLNAHHSGDQSLTQVLLEGITSMCLCQEPQEVVPTSPRTTRRSTAIYPVDEYAYPLDAKELLEERRRSLNKHRHLFRPVSEDSEGGGAPYVPRRRRARKS
uniref:Uncharacterized protein n=1 Tax=Grammatophora oceanica TaxID=210454 RepID=A0A7S1Y6Q5_9STRA|mmetsp:Transcript_27376/g.40101  ORF Transcript_27376/g.40101 Transcript_27376/m.40101 type:complete len:186 (+) Transcript_27376:173-730(+)|eukprot:CAMPEP_0194049010 /NCGR_PEP_ID=MMETSP0009_2-20130614/29371_1 /TAXON_ID=210454 /ORGANISM="Grammatophora oceanica, Strain CCMP 410" /LENGTH=185 /DNA_ID=CAMNT_0038695061 /DNA_START=165 /DNA_END=722 /DNA_ORIENTATION=+